MRAIEAFTQQKVREDSVSLPAGPVRSVTGFLKPARESVQLVPKNADLGEPKSKTLRAVSGTL